MSETIWQQATIEGGNLERDISTRSIVEASQSMHVWRCSRAGCVFHMKFRMQDIEHAGFFVVRHLLRFHNSPEEIIAEEPYLAAEVHSYCKSMGLGR